MAPATYPRVWRAGPARACCRSSSFPAYLVLLRVGFTMPPALLPARCALTAPFHPYPMLAQGAVFSLWHWPSRRLQAPIPGVTRHTAPWSPDFPPLLRQTCAKQQRSFGPPACSVYRQRLQIPSPRFRIMLLITYVVWLILFLWLTRPTAPPNSTGGLSRELTAAERETFAVAVES